MTPEQYTVIAAAVIAGIYLLFGGKSSFPAIKHGAAGYTPRGLMNLGSTCFYNAVLQALSACETFCKWLEFSSPRRYNYRFSSMLLHMLKDINSSEEQSSDTRLLSNLLDAVRDAGWVVENGQQDAHELYQAMMNMLISDKSLQTHDFSSLDEESDVLNGSVVHRANIHPAPLIHNNLPLHGHIASSMRCKSCLKKTPYKYDGFTSLSLTFPPSKQGPFTLDDLLKYFFISDNLTDVNCENCQSKSGQPYTVKTDFLKEQCIGSAPQCLCLHVQRLGWYGHHQALKRFDKVRFPSLLDMGPHTQVYKMMNYSKLSQSLSGLGDTTVTAPPTEPAVANHTISSWYKLVAVIEHQGDENSGHFITYRKVDSNYMGGPDRWIYTSDIYIREVTIEEVLSRSPYMLFYEKMPKATSS